MNNTYSTSRLILKPISENDADFFLKLMNEPNYKRFIADRKLSSLHEVKQFLLERYIHNSRGSTICNFTVIKKDNFVRIGSCGIFKRSELLFPDIGFAFLEEHQNHGYAYEAASLVKSIALTEFGYKQLAAITVKDNLTSQKLIKKLGLTFTKMMKIDDEFIQLYELKTV